MKSAWIAAAALVLVAAAGFAEPSPVPLSAEALAVILGPSTAGPGCAPESEGTQPTAPRPASWGVETSACNATAQCYSGTVSCSGNSSCSAVDRNCAVPTAGYVICDGVYHGCPVACTACDQCAATGECIPCCQCDGYTYVMCVRGIC
jgi:hypothetical protein